MVAKRQVMLGAAVVLTVAGCGDNVPLDSVWGGNLAVGNGRVYYTTFTDESEHAVMSMSAGGGEPHALWRGGPHQLFGDGMAVDAERVYWPEEAPGGGNALFAVAIDGGERVEIARFSTSNAARGGIVVTPAWVWAAGGGELMRASLTGGSREVVVESGPTRRVAGIATNGSALVAAIAGDDPQLLRVNASTGTMQEIYSGPVAWPFCVGTDAAYMPTEYGFTVIALDGSGIRGYLDIKHVEGCAVGADGLYTVVRGESYDPNRDITRVGFDGTTSVVAHAETLVLDQLVIANNRLHYAGLDVLGSVDLSP